MPAPVATAILASAFISSLGINTHLHFKAYGYQDVAVVVRSLKYLGLENVRDSPQDPGNIALWKRMAEQANVKFNAYIPTGGPADMEESLDLMEGLAKEGILNFIEGPNEPDTPFAIKHGNSVEHAMRFQYRVYRKGRDLGLPVINISFGSGWTAANNWQGNYDKVGNMSHLCDYANGHVYPQDGPGQPGKTIVRLTNVSQLAAPGKPTIVTEVGWDEPYTKPDVIARYVLNAAMDGWKNGNPKTYFYAMFDDKSGQFGLMNKDGTPKLAGQALHNLTTLLRDTNAATFKPGTLTYRLTDTAGSENTILMQKSDGSYWVSVWDETSAPHAVKLVLARPARSIQVFDPLTGTEAVTSQVNARGVDIALASHPLLVRIVTADPITAGNSGGQAF